MEYKTYPVPERWTGLAMVQTEGCLHERVFEKSVMARVVSVASGPIVSQSSRHSVQPQPASRHRQNW